MLKGFKFGLMLQFAVGPMCLMVFNVSQDKGFFSGMSLVLAIALIDALYISLSGVGIVSFLKKENVVKIIKIIGSVVLIVFGMDTIMSVFNMNIIPGLSIGRYTSSENYFIEGLILTASNPLTIIFWSGVFSTQIINNKMQKKELVLFGCGCVMSTLFFLSVICCAGKLVGTFLPEIIIKILKTAVGVLIVYFGLMTVLKKE